MSDTPVRFNSRAARAMRAAYEGGKDGALISVTAGAKRLVFFEKGYLVGAKSERLEERLGEVIVAEGGVSRAQLEEATRFIRSGMKLGQILVELGHLRSGQIETYIRRQIIRIGSAILTSEPERLLFSTTIPVEAVTLSPVSIGDVFLDAAAQLADIGLYREKLLLDDYVLAQTRDALALVSDMKLSADEAQVLDLVDEKNTVGEIVAASFLSQDRTLRLLLALRQAGIVALKPERAAPLAMDAAPPAASEIPAPAPDPFESELISFFNVMQCQNHWQVLGLERKASYPEIERAYEALSKRFHSEKQSAMARDMQEKLSSVRARLKEAFITLSSKTSTSVYHRMVEREEQYEEKKQSWKAVESEKSVASPSATEEPASRGSRKSPEESKALFLQAKRAYKEQDFWRAIELCRASIELSEDNDPERFHLLGRALSENPRWRKDAEQNLKIAHNLKPWEPRYLVSLAKLYEKCGLQHRAQRTYEQVRVMDPDFAIGEEAEGKITKNESAAVVLDEKAV
jgi:curved DNA-binding protein CbpA